MIKAKELEGKCEKCKKCKGEKKLRKIDIANAQVTWEDCPDCRGTGLNLPTQKVDGLHATEILGKLINYTWEENGRTKATALVVVRVVRNETTKHTQIVLFIWNMNTPKHHRRKGYMSKLISTLKISFEGRVKYMLTNYKDSSKESINFLLKHGFKRLDVLLLWRQEEKEEKNGK